MAGQEFNVDQEDKPVFDDFGIPAVCASDNGDEDPCCDPCSSWLNCLERVPFRLDLSGFDFSEWLPWIRHSDKLLVENNVAYFTGADESGTNEWYGTYIALPRNYSQSCDGIEREECDACGTHWTPSWRTVATPNSAVAPVRRYYLDLNVSCETNDEDEKCLKFAVLLYYESEEAGLELPPFHDYAGGELPMYAGESAIRGCCPVLESDCIPLAGLTWEDLQDLALHPVEPGEQVYGPEGASCSWCGETRMQHGATKLNPPPPVGPDPPSGCAEYYEGDEGFVVFNECHENSPGVTGSLPGVAPFHGCYGEFCCPPPIIVNGDNFLSVLAESCDRPQGCGHCVRTEPVDRSQPATAVEVDFEWTPAVGCCKKFTAIVPECLLADEGGTNLRYYWSFGLEGREIYYCLRNLKVDDLTNYEELIHLTVVNVATGCIYYASHVVGCGCDCVEGESITGSLSVALVDEENCVYRLTASITAPPECEETAFIMVSGACLPLFAEDWPCWPGGTHYGIVLTDGQYFDVALDSGCCDLTWELFDDICGCVGPRTPLQICCNECECCEGPIGGAMMSVTGIGTTNGLCDCSDLNLSLDVPIDEGEPCNSASAFSDPVSIGTECGEVTIQLAWNISCDPETGYWLRLLFSADGASTGDGFLDIFLGMEMPTCADISECAAIDAGGFLCDYNSITVCAEFYP